MNKMELKAIVRDYIANEEISDVVLNSFITLCEARVNKMLRVTDMQQCAHEITEPCAKMYPLPADYLELISINYDCIPMQFIPANQITKYQKELPEESCVQRYYTLIGHGIKIVPVPSRNDGSIEIFYYKRIPPLISDTDMNWLLSKSPDIYIYGSLLQATAYTYDDERIAIWTLAYDQAMNELDASDWNAQFSGSKLDYQPIV